jgi:hypothetical protein
LALLKSEILKNAMPEMNMSTDFFAKRLAAIEEEKARRVAAMEEEEAAQAYAYRLNQQIPLIVDCIEKMGLAGLSREDIADLFRHAADELEKSEQVGD